MGDIVRDILRVHFLGLDANHNELVTSPAIHNPCHEVEGLDGLLRAVRADCNAELLVLLLRSHTVLIFNN